jgi:hypothetical protein
MLDLTFVGRIHFFQIFEQVSLIQAAALNPALKSNMKILENIT